VSGTDISVLLMTHNHKEFIEEAVADLDAQRVAGTVEVIAADDASTDGTRAFLQDWARIAGHPVRILPPHERLGITRGTSEPPSNPGRFNQPRTSSPVGGWPSLG
jgi:glycosyltransferase involved in cell wall biosynthesis